MNKVKTLDDLRKMRESLRASLDLREKSNNPEQMVQPWQPAVSQPEPKKL